MSFATPSRRRSDMVDAGIAPRTLVQKIWDAHIVAELGGGLDLLHIDRHLIHDLSGPASLGMLAERGLPVRSPELTFAMPDHTVSTAVGRTDADTGAGRTLVPALRERTHAEGIRLFDLDDPEQGIVHIVGPELGLTLPGVTVVCGDSHTCTHGGLGALGWGIGSSDLTHVLATQTIVQRRPKQMRVVCSGRLGTGVEPKDLVLYLIGEHGADGATGFAVEYAGSAIDSMGVEGRMTMCNLAIEFGAKIGIVAPDDATFDYVAGRRYAPTGARWELALASWRELASDADAAFDSEIEIDAAAVSPQITWGTSPAHTMALDGEIPDPEHAQDPAARLARSKALGHMGLNAGGRLLGVPVQHVFIGSCANSRISDLKTAAQLVRGRHVAQGVQAWVVPGSQAVRREAEQLGLDRVFTAAGFQWREPGCSMCLGVNDELIPPGERCVATSNRNFVGRQGPGARTHLAGVATAAAAAIAGRIADPREFTREPADG
jgi:3-isopropylmalate/(R)-2-methylmalate dehydratase large subunit